MHRPARLLCLVCLLGLVALLGAACGGPDGDARGRATAATTTRAGLCALLPRAAVEAAFGEPVVAGPQSSDECWWSTGNDLKTVNLIRRHDDLATWRQGYANDFWAPNDFGDEGYTGRALQSIVWRIGDTQYEVNVVFSTKGDPDRVAQELATEVADRVGA